jgi:hypothetical protein
MRNRLEIAFYGWIIKMCIPILRWFLKYIEENTPVEMLPNKESVLVNIRKLITGAENET